MFWIAYRFFIVLLELGLRIHSIWDRQSQTILTGRRHQDVKLGSWLKANVRPLIQIHCASLGEFELSLPLYKKLKEDYPGHKFLFTFFSPSGYQHAKIPNGCEKAYLPLDRKKKVQSFLKLINPSLVIFIKYEYWFQYLTQLNKRNTPYGYVNVNQQSFPTNLKFSFAKKLLNLAKFIFVSNDKTYDDFLANGIKVTGHFLDLRYTKSKQILIEKYEAPHAFIKFLNHKQVIICGSVWKEDLEVLIPVIKKHVKINWVIAPHQVGKASLDFIKTQFPKLSSFSSNKLNESNILLIDTIGDLKYLYRYGSLNYVGGAFNTGLHNVLEPISTGSPVVFGPKYHRYPEAAQLVSKKNAYSISRAEEFDEIIKNLEMGSLHLGSMDWLKEKDTGLTEMSLQIGQHL